MPNSSAISIPDRETLFKTKNKITLFKTNGLTMEPLLPLKPIQVLILIKSTQGSTFLWWALQANLAVEAKFLEYRPSTP